MRCVTQVHGAALAALRTARDHVELELNSAADSPLVLADAGEMLSNGNFHIPGARARLRRARPRARARGAAVRRSAASDLFARRCPDLPLQLTTRGPEHSGFATIQKTLTALYNEIRHLANPASLDSLPVSEAVEDHAPMAPTSSRRPPRSWRCCTTWPRSSSWPPRRPSTCASLPHRGARARDAAAALRRRARTRCRGSTTIARSVPTSRRSPTLLAAGGHRHSAICCRDEVAPQQLGPGAGRALRAHRHRRHVASHRVRAVARRSASGRRATTASSAGRSRSVGLPVHDSDARVSRAADPDRRPRPDQRDHLHGRVLADDPDPQRRDRHSRGAGRRRRRRARHGHEPVRDPDCASSCRSRCRSSSPDCASRR